MHSYACPGNHCVSAWILPGLDWRDGLTTQTILGLLSPRLFCLVQLRNLIILARSLNSKLVLVRTLESPRLAECTYFTWNFLLMVRYLVLVFPRVTSTLIWMSQKKLVTFAWCGLLFVATDNYHWHDKHSSHCTSDSRSSTDGVIAMR